jgi:hypothetical protein
MWFWEGTLLLDGDKLSFVDAENIATAVTFLSAVRVTEDFEPLLEAPEDKRFSFDFITSLSFRFHSGAYLDLFEIAAPIAESSS